MEPALSVMNNNMYYDARVDNKTALVGFGKTQPAGFKNAKVFVGIAHAGYHVFPGRRGEVIEAHSMRMIVDPSNIESAPFNPLGSGGAPHWTRSEKYRSGLIAVPKDF
jgi:hypothetical protein